MEAKSVDTIPAGPEWQYEPKWDGFRCLAFRDGQRVELQSKSGQPLGRYFPELVEALLALPASKFVPDAE
ncbi:MAG TPA: ATP-dependent DNA ligase, partial [Candidatus Eisenbacteria bacterium]|nr:ATP-dependent DNA ligase [Candidatus Eisenbacteria bacterium]